MTNSTSSGDYVDGSSSNRSPNPPPNTEESPRRHSSGNITPRTSPQGRGSPHRMPPMGVPGQSAFRPFQRPHQPHWPSSSGSGGTSLTGGLTGLQGAHAVPIGRSDFSGTDARGTLLISGSPSARKRSREGDGSSGAEAAGGNQPVEAGANAINCSLCGREFLSPKALFGHMRSHPDRGWKGARPPPAFRAEEEFADLREDRQGVAGDAGGEAHNAGRVEAATEGDEEKEEAEEGKGYRVPDLNK